jgi:hypothetical protein
MLRYEEEFVGTTAEDAIRKSSPANFVFLTDRKMRSRKTKRRLLDIWDGTGWHAQSFKVMVMMMHY